MARRSVRPVAHGVDVGVRFERDEQMTQAVFQAPFCGRGELYAPPRRALAGARHPPHAARGTAPPGPAARPKPAVGFPAVGPGQSTAPRGAGGSDPSAGPRNRASRVSHTGSGLTGVTNCRSLRRVMRPRGLQKTAAVGMFVVSVAAVMRSPRSVAWEQSRRGSRGSFSRRAARVRRRDARRCGWTGSLPARPGRRECRRAAPQASAGSTRPGSRGRTSCPLRPATWRFCAGLRHGWPGEGCRPFRGLLVAALAERQPTAGLGASRRRGPLVASQTLNVTAHSCTQAHRDAGPAPRSHPRSQGRLAGDGDRIGDGGADLEAIEPHRALSSAVGPSLST